MTLLKKAALMLAAICMPNIAFAAVDTGDSAWILTATALVLFMTLPGLALFYAGLVQPKNVVSVLMHHFALACLMSILWVVAGYSLAFNGDGAWVGDLSGFMMSSISFDSLSGLSDGSRQAGPLSYSIDQVEFSPLSSGKSSPLSYDEVSVERLKRVFENWKQVKKSKSTE